MPDDVVEVGIWLHDEDYEYEHDQTLTLYFLQGGRGFDIPPHGTLMTQLKAKMRLVLVKPSGRLESADFDRFFDEHSVGMLSVLPGDFKAAIADALGQRVKRHG